MTDTRVPIKSIRIAEAARSLSVSTDHIRDLIDEGEFLTAKSGRNVLIDWESFSDYYERKKRSS